MNTEFSELCLQRLFCRFGLLDIDNESGVSHTLSKGVRCIFHCIFPFLIRFYIPKKEKGVQLNALHMTVLFLFGW